VLFADDNQGGKQSIRRRPSRLTIEFQTDRLTVDGVISSTAHDNILRNTAARLFDDRAVEFSVDIQIALPPGWSLVTDMTLQAMAARRSSAAVIDRSGIWVRGFTGDNDHRTNAVARFESALPEGWTLRYRVEEIAASAYMHRQCIELFRTATRSRKIAFQRASASLGTANAPLLDKLIQIITDCRGAGIEITGHTDSSGDEAVNLALGKARADAVADYRVSGGVPRDRINATGVGSAEPLTDEDSPQARQLNRRIEIELRFP
jgi:OOP family OmpA-OmpF porin